MQEQLASAEANFEEGRQLLADVLDLARDCHAAYLEAGDNDRRLFNQAFFSKIYIDEDEETRERSVRVDYNQPFDDLLARLVPAHVHSSLQATEKQTARPEDRTGGNAPTTGVAEGQGCPPSTLVELRGFEPLAFSLRRRSLHLGRDLRALATVPPSAPTSTDLAAGGHQGATPRGPSK